jgi:hypothetical protein
MPGHRLQLDVLPESLAICRLAFDAPIPAWATARPFFTVSRTTEELSVICPADQVPAGVTASDGWRALKLRGPFDLGVVGILVAIAAPLAAAGISIMPVATYETDYVLVREIELERAIDAIRRAGHDVHAPSDVRVSVPPIVL